MHDNIEKNLKLWDKQHPWPQDGDEWNGQAAVCEVPYPVWKESLVRHLIVPNVNDQMHVLEIAPGHGRWTEHLIKHAGHVTAVDLSPACVAFCKGRFEAATNIDYSVTPGDRLPDAGDATIDFVWSFDAFVHMAPQVIQSYLGEIARVLKPSGEAIIHHANVADPDTHVHEGAPGWRSAMTGEIMRQMARDAGLTVVRQFVYWDEANKLGVPRFNDRITQLRR